MMDNPDAAGGAVVASEGGPLSTSAMATGDPFLDAMPFTSRVWFDERLFTSVQRAAKMMSEAKGFVSPNLAGKPETCFSVALTALDAGLNPFMLGQGAYQTPDGKVGYETKAVQAIVEGKGFFSKPPKLDFSGPWEKLIGMHKMDGKVARKTWTAEDAKGCKLQVTFFFRDLVEPVVCEPMDLAEVGTHFSTGWALEPKSQFTRLVIRRQLQLKRPSILAGVRCIEDLADENPGMKDITPPKDGNVGLDEFASSSNAPANETVVEEKAQEPETTAAPADDDVPAAEPEGQKEPETAKPEGITLWVSAEEPSRLMKDIPAAVFVLRRLIKEANTAALAKVVFDRNMPIIGALDKKTADDIEAIMNRRFEDG